MARKDPTFTDADIIRFFLRNLDGREQKIVLCWFKGVLEEYLAATGVSGQVIDSLLDYLIGKIPFLPLADALTKLRVTGLLTKKA